MAAPLQNLLLIFGGGGLLAGALTLGSSWVNRRRLQVRVLSEHYDLTSDDELTVTMKFEVSNVGDKVTSIEREVDVRALSLEARALKYTFLILDVDRQLTPHASRSFTARTSASPGYVYCWLKRYNFRPARGAGAVLRVRNAQNETLGFFRYWFEYSMFRFFGKVKGAA